MYNMYITFTNMGPSGCITTCLLLLKNMSETLNNVLCRGQVFTCGQKIINHLKSIWSTCFNTDIHMLHAYICRNSL